MKILLAKLKSEADEIIPPIGLGYLATAVRKKHEVEILDCLKGNIGIEKLVDFIAKKNFDLAGVLFFTMNFPDVKKFSELLKQKSPGTKLVVGGPHPSALPEDTMKNFPFIDFAFAGEAELGFPMLADILESKNCDAQALLKIPALVWRNGKKIVVNEKKTVCDLDSLGFPSWDLLKPESYPQAPHGSFCKQFPVAPIIITRGCPYSCTFCAGHVVSGKKLRSRTLENVLYEIRGLVKNHGIKEIHIEDDNFTFNRQFVVDFCNAIINENLNISWACPNGMRLDTLDKELLALMKKSGLYSISVGIESGSDRILKLVKKSLTTEKIREKVQLIHDAGLHVIGFIILGFPGETKEDIEKTIDFVCTLPINRVAFSCLQPFPGSEVYNNLLEKGEIKNVSWETCFLFKATYSPKGISIEELRKLRQKGLRRFYLRPKIMLSMLREIKSPRHFFFVLKRGIRWLFLN